MSNLRSFTGQENQKFYPLICLSMIYAVGWPLRMLVYNGYLAFEAMMTWAAMDRDGRRIKIFKEKTV